jgi:uracil-DNA glycosylase family 4
MSDAYNELLEATIQHLEQRKREGERFVALNPAALKELSDCRPARVVVAPKASPSPSSSPARENPRPKPVLQSRTEPSMAAAPAPAVPVAPEVSVITPGAPLSKADKEVAIQELRERALVCQKCPHLVRSRKNVVFGVGDIHARLMFVGEAPGADEDTQGEPFVGAAGQLLTKIIQTMGLTRQTVYIANILKCRPDTPGQLYGNRKPVAEEMKTCLPYLLAQIDIIQPRIIVALGATAMEGLFGKPVPITRARGTFVQFRGIPVMPTFHPSYLLRTETPLTEKRKTWEDMLQVMGKLEMPISEKQQSYFTKA